jgi:hypothetical protein
MGMQKVEGGFQGNAGFGNLFASTTNLLPSLPPLIAASPEFYLGHRVLKGVITELPSNVSSTVELTVIKPTSQGRASVPGRRV